jgi:DHA2 family multidrug resistance protein-like MFS transporter
MFTDPAQRTKAIGIWSGVMTAGIALGSVMSGVLVEHFWWGSVFLVNLPAMVLLLVLGPVLLPESRSPGQGRFDWLSVPLSMAAVLPVIYGLKELASQGWNVRYVLSVTVGLLFAALFVHRQRTAVSPLISPALFRSRGFTPALVLNLVAAFGMMGSAYFTTQYIQSVLDKSPLEAALWSLLPSVPIGLAAPASARLVQRGVPRAYVVGGGFAVTAVGYVLLALAGTDSLWLLLSACAVLACGVVAVMSQVADLALSAAPVEKAGAASSLLETGTEFGGALSMAFLGSIGTAVYRHEIPASAPAPARETLGGALAVADRLPGRAGDALATAAREAFTSGMHAAAVTSAVLLVGAAVAATVTLRRVNAHDNAGRAERLSPSGV